MEQLPLFDDLQEDTSIILSLRDGMESDREEVPWEPPPNNQ